VQHQASPFSTSALATAGGVVFSGDVDPSLKAFDDTTGKLLWQAALDDLPSSTVITYAVGKTQYVAIVLGLTNDHVNNLSRTYNTFRKNRGLPPIVTKGGAAVWVFSL
jgi:alcohol dehydrogenase (cytochrome c)